MSDTRPIVIYDVGWVLSSISLPDSSSQDISNSSLNFCIMYLFPVEERRGHIIYISHFLPLLLLTRSSLYHVPWTSLSVAINIISYSIFASPYWQLLQTYGGGVGAGWQVLGRQCHANDHPITVFRLGQHTEKYNYNVAMEIACAATWPSYYLYRNITEITVKHHMRINSRSSQSEFCSANISS